ncbi:MAG: hypothetical protein AAF298_07335 [Cyanobacteria bacterium P01_A01_bin.40]
MLTLNTFNLTSEQIEQIRDYKDKWQQVALSTSAIDRDQVILSINKAYEFISLPQPNIIFFATPYEALNYLYQEIINSWGKLENTALGKPVAGDLLNQLIGNIRTEIRKELLEPLQGNLDNELANKITLNATSNFQENELFSIIIANFRVMAIILNSDTDELSKAMFNLFIEFGFVFNNYFSPTLWKITNLFNSNQQKSNKGEIFTTLLTGRFEQTNSSNYQLPFIEVTSKFTNLIVPSVLADFAYYIDYCHEVLGCDRDTEKWDIFSDLITTCGWVFPYEKTVLVCER